MPSGKSKLFFRTALILWKQVDQVRAAVTAFLLGVGLVVAVLVLQSSTSLAGIVTGVVAAAIFEFAILTVAIVKIYTTTSAAQDFFGECSSLSPIGLVYNTFSLHPDILNAIKSLSQVDTIIRDGEYFYVSRGEIAQDSLGVYRLDEPAPHHDLAAAAYMLKVLSEKSIPCNVSSASETSGQVDRSIIAFGFGANVQSNRCLAELRRYNSGKFSYHAGRLTLNECKLGIATDNNEDYAYIIKVRPELYPNRVWIIVGGGAEAGTTGAAYWLSRNWAKLPRMKATGSGDPIGYCEFIAVLRVNKGFDQTAKLTDLYRLDI